MAQGFVDYNLLFSWKVKLYDDELNARFDPLRFIEKLEKQACLVIRQQLSQKAKKDAFSEAMDTQLICKSDWMEMENRLIKWSAGLALGQVAVIAALVKLL